MSSMDFPSKHGNRSASGTALDFGDNNKIILQSPGQGQWSMKPMFQTG